MLRLVLAAIVLFVFFRILWPRLRINRILKGEWRARYNRAEWEKIKRQFKKK